MTASEAKEKLLEIRTRYYQARDAIDKMNEIRAALCCPSMPDPSKVKVQTSHYSNKQEDLLIKLVEQENIAVESVHAFLALSKEYSSLIDSNLTGTARRVMYLHYINMLTLSKVADALEMSDGHIIRVHGQGLRVLAQVM